MVIGLSITPGQEITASATALTISDTNTVTISATVDERNVSYLKVGMGVDLNQWGNPSFGTISSVSLSSSVNNGVATYPFTIEADNADGTLQINSNINYNLTASQSDNCLVLPIQAVRTVGLEDGTSATVVYLKADSMPDKPSSCRTPTRRSPRASIPCRSRSAFRTTTMSRSSPAWSRARRSLRSI